MRSFTLALAALATFGAAGAALAAGAPTPGKFIHPADTNKDQKIDKAEWVKFGNAAADFAKADTNRDGFVNGPEMVLFSHPELAKPQPR
jgi:hypothetical protein